MWSETIRELGRDPEEFYNELQQDMERFKSLGIELPLLSKTLNAKKQSEPQGDDDDE